MNCSAPLGRLTAVAILAACIIGGSSAAHAGETSVYLKSGWYSWQEKINGTSFLRESGALHAAGVLRKDPVAVLNIAERFEVWGGNLDYDGHDVTGTIPIKSDTSYIGTREEVILSGELPPAWAVIFEPFATIGHKFWIRTRSSERWNCFYAKAGVSAEVRSSGATFFAKGGAIIPIYTRSHVDLSESGYDDVVTEPSSRVSGFAEGGVKVGDFTMSVEYEATEYGESDKVATRGIGTGKGAAVINGLAYQPASSSSFFSLKLAYTF